MVKTIGKYFVFLLFFTISLAQALTTPTITDPNKPIIVSKKNPSFKIVLQANPTTGFSWFVKNYNSQFITAQTAEFIPPAKPLPGRGGIAVWTFQATATALRVPTLTPITLTYARPWTVSEGTEQTFTVITQP